MALTLNYKATVIERLKSNPGFVTALYAEALESLLTGETEVGLTMLRDLVHATITFKELARITGIGEKSLHRTLSRHGNPRASTIGKVVVGIRDALGYVPQVSIATAKALET